MLRLQGNKKQQQFFNAQVGPDQCGGRGPAEVDLSHSGTRGQRSEGSIELTSNRMNEPGHHLLNKTTLVQSSGGAGYTAAHQSVSTLRKGLRNIFFFGFGFKKVLKQHGIA